MAVTFRVLLRGAPLRRTYVSHFDFFRVPQTLFFRTDEDGHVTVANAGNANVTADPSGPNGTIKVRVHAQNAVVRVLDGALPLPIEVSQEFEVSNTLDANINTNAEQQDHFRIMDACLEAYDLVFRQFAPFNRSGRRAFPFGQAASILATRNMTPRIEVSYPDQGPTHLAWVEPASVGTGFPLIHLKDKNFDPPGPGGPDRRLFGAPDASPPVLPTLIPHELAHALYFSLMSATTRASVEGQYLAWITSRIAAGLPPFHNTGLVTNPFVAWIESLGLFAAQFFAFRRLHTPAVDGVALRKAFFRDELSASPLLEGNLRGYLQVGRLNAANKIEPEVTGVNVEGAVYGAVFLDFARRVGLREAVGRYLTSADNNVLTFDDLHNLIIDETDFDDDIREVRNTWA
jgi:hypothetical protein